MKTLKKIIGGILVSLFISFAIGCFIYNIYTAGWYFIFSLIFIIAIVGLFILGVFFLSDSSQAE